METFYETKSFYPTQVGHLGKTGCSILYKYSQDFPQIERGQKVIKKKSLIFVNYFPNMHKGSKVEKKNRIGYSSGNIHKGKYYQQTRNKKIKVHNLQQNHYTADCLS